MNVDREWISSLSERLRSAEEAFLLAKFAEAETHAESLLDEYLTLGTGPRTLDEGVVRSCTQCLDILAHFA